MTLKKLGRYELLEQLGEGGMGTVWLARLSGAAGFEKLCIVKTVLPSIAKDQEFVSRFLHEGRVLTQLAHGNIAQVLDMNEEGGELFLALEYVAGVDLSRLQEQVRAAGEAVPVAVAVALVQQAAEGLGAAHRKTALDGTPLQVVHRDVSPQNIMVSYEGEVKVIDFGIARSEARSRHTAQASVMGKLGYMAPEQARGEHVDHRADQFALGIVLWELLANQPYVRRGTLTEMVVSMASPVIRPLGPLRADVPGSLETVVLRALSATPDARFPSTDEFAQALTAELMKLGVSLSKPQLGEYVRQKCATAFAAQQTLLTRVSTLRGPPPKPDEAPRPQVLATPAAFAPTAMMAPKVGAAADGVVTADHREKVAAAQADTAPMRGTGGDASSGGEGAGSPPAGSAADTWPMPPPNGAPASRGSAPTPATTGELVAAVAPKRVPAAAVVLVGVIGLIVAALVLLGRGSGGAAASVDAGVAVAPVTPEPTPAAVVDVDAGAATEVTDAGVALAEAVDAVDAGVAEVAPEEQPTLNGSLRFGGGAYILTNRNRTTWTGCTLTAPGRKTVSLGSVSAGTSIEMPARRLVATPDARELERQVRIDCEQGFGLWPLR
jgi:serine/threonine-protein kinase